MVNSPLSIGGLLGVALSGAFMYWQVGRYAAPQVARTLFDERKEVFAYTAGLFSGIPLALPLLFYLDALGFGALPAAAIDLALLVAAAEVGQWALLRSRYFGEGESGAFYAIGWRAGVGGLLILALVAQYLSGPSVSAIGFGVVAVQSVAVLAVEVAAGLLSARGPARLSRLGGSPLAGGLFAAFGFFLIGVGSVIDPASAALAAAIAAAGAIWVFQRLERTVLGGLLPPRRPEGSPEEPAPYARLRTESDGGAAEKKRLT